MSFGRKLMKSMGLSEELQDALMEEHMAVVNGIKESLTQALAEAEKYKADAAKLADLQTKYDAVKGYKEKYETEHSNFESYKNQETENARLGKVEKAFRKLLEAEKVNPKRYDAVVRLTDLTKLELEEDGETLKNADTLRNGIKTEWSEYITTTENKGADVGTPPDKDKGGFSGMSLAEKMAYANQNPNAPEVTAWLNQKG